MSAEELRKAAALMRERAEAATDGLWFFAAGPGGPGVIAEDTLGDWIGNITKQTTEPDAEHIASWHPAVALAVADLLEETAADIDALMTYGGHALALAVARAYLGEQS